MVISELVSHFLERSFLVQDLAGQVTGVAWPVSSRHLVTAASSLSGHFGQSFVIRSAEGVRRVNVVEAGTDGLDFGVLVLQGGEPNLEPLRTYKMRRFGGDHYVVGLSPMTPSFTDIEIYEITSQGDLPGLQSNTLRSAYGQRIIFPGTPIVSGSHQAIVGIGVPRAPSNHLGRHDSGVVLWDEIWGNSWVLRDGPRRSGKESVKAWQNRDKEIEEITLPSESAEQTDEVPFDDDTAGADEVSEIDEMRSIPCPPCYPTCPLSPDVEFELELEDGPVAPEQSQSQTPFRFPFASFHRITAEEDQEIPTNDPLELPPEDSHLEFCFGFSMQSKGIPQSKKSVLVPPDKIPYPIDVQIDVWSEELHFDKDRSTARLRLEASGQDSSVRFPIRTPPFAIGKEQATVFVFIRHDTHLIGVFHITVGLVRSNEPMADAIGQRMDHAYLDQQWFRFVKTAISAPALTIFIRENDGRRLDIFAFCSQQPIWARSGINVDGLYVHARDIYLTTTELAKKFGGSDEFWFKESKFKLSLHGYSLFSDLFFAKPDRALADLAHFIQSLSDGAEVNIAIDSHRENLIIPWGFIYDRTPPENAFSGVVDNDAFWGKRFQLTVRPSVEGVESPTPSLSQLTVGHVYESPEAQQLATNIRDLLVQNNVKKTKEIEIKDSWLPELAAVQFDLLHFNCHGYIKLSDPLLLNLLEGIDTGVLKYIRDPAKGSQLFTCEATATLAVLQVNLPRLCGSPLVVLSMCHSAQVSSCGGSFVTFFLDRGARAVVGTEGPNPFALALVMDEAIIKSLLQGDPLRSAVWKSRKTLVDTNPLALIYTVYGDGQATLSAPVSSCDSF